MKFHAFPDGIIVMPPLLAQKLYNCHILAGWLETFPQHSSLRISLGTAPLGMSVMCAFLLFVFLESEGSQ